MVLGNQTQADGYSAGLATPGIARDAAVNDSEALPATNTYSLDPIETPLDDSHVSEPELDPWDEALRNTGPPLAGDTSLEPSDSLDMPSNFDSGSAAHADGVVDSANDSKAPGRNSADESEDDVDSFAQPVEPVESLAANATIQVDGLHDMIRDEQTPEEASLPSDQTLTTFKSISELEAEATDGRDGEPLIMDTIHYENREAVSRSPAYDPVIQPFDHFDDETSEEVNPAEAELVEERLDSPPPNATLQADGPDAAARSFRDTLEPAAPKGVSSIVSPWAPPFSPAANDKAQEVENNPPQNFQSKLRKVDPQSGEAGRYSSGQQSATDSAFPEKSDVSAPIADPHAETTAQTPTVAAPEVGRTSAYEQGVLQELSSVGGERPFLNLIEQIRGKCDYRFPGSMVLCSPDATPRTADVLARLALLLSQGEEDLLLVDANEKSTLSKNFGIANTAGVSEVLAGETGPLDVVRPTGRAKLSIVSFGKAGKSIPRDDATLSDRGDELIKTWERQYHRVLIDVGGTQSNLLPAIVKHCSCSVLLIPFDKPDVAAINAAQGKLHAVATGPIGCIITDEPAVAPKTLQNV